MEGIELSLFVSRLGSVCEEMGATLRRSAFSPNIKDRLDFSCAVFDPHGELCAQAAHIPVHLGSMAYAMRDIVGGNDWQPGDMLILNDPYLGGTHLPDVTLVAPVYLDQQLVAFCANRAHHADIGCDRPGSMPLSRHLDEEGLVLSPRLYLRANVPEPALQALLHERLRNPAATLGDFAAQVSANRTGAQRLSALAQRYGQAAFARGLGAVNDYAERLARATLAALPDGRYEAADVLDDDGFAARDIPLRVSLAISDDSARVDFHGTAAAVAGNVNCPISVTAAAVYYAFYCMMPDTTPPCAGSLRPITLNTEPGSIVDARAPAAVAAGNVETSQRIVDVVLAALAAAAPDALPAASQGTMNNLAMGGDGWDYYETIAGGTGAHADGPGLDGAHSHMTNTLNTPVEVLESVYPVRVRRYALRDDSGGRGRHPGGRGIVREFEFVDTAAVTLLGERRRHAPPGAAGGEGGAPGRNSLNGVGIPGKCEIDVRAGDVLTIETPGGGGWGGARAE